MYAEYNVSVECTATDYLPTRYYLQKFCGVPTSNKDRKLDATENSALSPALCRNRWTNILVSNSEISYFSLKKIKAILNASANRWNL